MVRIRVSYEEPQELQVVVQRLEPMVKSCKVAKGENGRFRRAYMDLEIPEGKTQ